MPRCGLSGCVATAGKIRASVARRVGVQKGAPLPGLRHAKPVAVSRDGGEVADVLALVVGVIGGFAVFADEAGALVDGGTGVGVRLLVSLAMNWNK